MTLKPLVLASTSAIRARILRQAGLDFSVARPDVDEDALKEGIKNTEISQQALFLAEAKALSISRQHSGLVIGADQMFVMEGQSFNKTKTLDEARERLLAMRGKEHSLMGGLVVCEGKRVVWRHASQAVVQVRDFSNTFLETYLDREGEAILSSVACYRYEGLGAQLFNRVEGSYYAILGLDLLPLLSFLRVHGAVLS